MSWYYHDTAFPCSRKLTHTLAYTPHAHGSLCRSPSAPLTTLIEPKVSYGVTRMAITVPRAPSVLQQWVKDRIAEKKGSQPLAAASAGCIFKNPRNISARI